MRLTLVRAWSFAKKNSAIVYGCYYNVLVSTAFQSVKKCCVWCVFLRECTPKKMCRVIILYTHSIYFFFPLRKGKNMCIMRVIMAPYTVMWLLCNLVWSFFFREKIGHFQSLNQRLWTRKYIHVSRLIFNKGVTQKVVYLLERLFLFT